MNKNSEPKLQTQDNELDEAKQIVLQNEGDLAIKFPSAEGSHLVTTLDGESLRAVYVGPFGPENRPIKISTEALMELKQQTEYMEIVELSETGLEESVLDSFS